MNNRYVAGAIGGGLFAGLGITAMMIIGEKRSGKPSEPIGLERNTAERLAMATPPRSELPSATEQAVTLGGRLLLCGLAGVAYAATSDEYAAPIVGVSFSVCSSTPWRIG